MKYLRPIAIVALVVCCAYISSAQTEVTLIGPGGVRAAVDKLTPGFEQKTGYKLKATFASGGASHKQVVAGGAFDVPVVQPPYDDVLSSGNVVPDSKRVLASVSVGVAIKAGSPKPDISSAEAVKKMFLNAKTITYPNAAGGAAAGVSLNETFKQLGIADQMQDKVKRGGPDTGGPLGMVARGDVEIALTFLSEMNPTPGVEIIGALPRDVCPPTLLVGFVSSHAKDPAAAKALLDYLSSPAADKVYKELNMNPGDR
jgi:molybdate transport system substrate-binding protein